MLDKQSWAIRLVIELAYIQFRHTHRHLGDDFWFLKYDGHQKQELHLRNISHE